MDCISRRRCLGLSSVALATFAGALLAAPPPKGGTTHPIPKIWRCAGQTDRAPDHVITMVPNQMSYIATVSAPPVTTLPKSESGAMTAAQAKASGCTRRVIEVRVPASTSSGCTDCYPNAEINVCAASFSDSTLFEHHCHVPKASLTKADCTTFRHDIEVYRKQSGATQWDPNPVATYVYRGFVDASGCRVAATHQGGIHDTAEVWPNVLPPSSGTDVYRVTSLPKFRGNLLDTVIFVEFGKLNR